MHVDSLNPIKIPASLCSFDKDFSRQISGETYDSESNSEASLEYDLYALDEVFSALKEYYQYQY